MRFCRRKIDDRANPKVFAGPRLILFRQQSVTFHGRYDSGITYGVNDLTVEFESNLREEKRDEIFGEFDDGAVGGKDVGYLPLHIQTRLRRMHKVGVVTGYSNLIALLNLIGVVWIVVSVIVTDHRFILLQWLQHVENVHFCLLETPASAGNERSWVSELVIDSQCNPNWGRRFETSDYIPEAF